MKNTKVRMFVTAGIVWVLIVVGALVLPAPAVSEPDSDKCTCCEEFTAVAISPNEYTKLQLYKESINNQKIMIENQRKMIDLLEKIARRSRENW